MSNEFIKIICGEKTEELLRHHNEFGLLAIIAHRAKIADTPDNKDLELGEALISSNQDYGITKQEFKRAIRNLEKWGLITTKKGPFGGLIIAKLTDSSIFDIWSE